MYKKKQSTYENKDYDFNIDKNKLNNDGNPGDIIGRFIDKQTGLYADITYYFVKDNQVFVKKMLTKSNRDNYSIIPHNKFYPIKKKSFKNGVTVPVPSDILYNLTQRYGKFKDHYTLKKGKWYLSK